jgi:hypothetical protein
MARAFLSGIFTQLRFLDYITDERNAAAICFEPLRVSEGAVNTAFDRDEG